MTGIANAAKQAGLRLSYKPHRLDLPRRTVMSILCGRRNTATGRGWIRGCASDRLVGIASDYSSHQQVHRHPSRCISKATFIHHMLIIIIILS
jgi:hypothetical protein